MNKIDIVVTTNFGLEAITKRELLALGYEDLKIENGKVTFEGDEMDIAISNIHLRTSDRVLIKMAEFEARSFEELFQGTKKVEWSKIIPNWGCLETEKENFIKCSVEGCENKSHCKNLCRSHFYKVYKK